MNPYTWAAIGLGSAATLALTILAAGAAFTILAIAVLDSDSPDDYDDELTA